MLHYVWVPIMNKFCTRKCYELEVIISVEESHASIFLIYNFGCYSRMCLEIPLQFPLIII